MAFTIAQSQPPSALPNSLDHGLEVHLGTYSILPFTCISKPAWLWPPCLQDYGLLVHLQSHSIMDSRCISKLAWYHPPWVSGIIHCCFPQVHMITVSKCISKLAWSQPWSVSPKLLNCGIPTDLITPVDCISQLIDHSLVNRWSLIADSQSSILHNTSHGIQTESVRTTGFSSSYIDREWQEMNGHPAMMNNINCMDLWMLCKRARGSTQTEWMYESLARVHETKSREWYSVYFVQWDDVNLPQGLPNIYYLSLSPTPYSLYLDKYVHSELYITHAIL